MKIIDSSFNEQADGSAEWLEARLQLRSDLNFDLRRRSEQSYAVIEDPVRSRFFQIGSEEYRFISKLNGQRSVREIIELSAADEQGPIENELAQTVCNWLAANNFLLNSGQQVEERLQLTAKSRQTSKTLSRLNPVCLKIRLLNPDRMLRRITPFLKWVFAMPMVVLWLFLGCYAVSELVQQWPRFSSSAVGILVPTRWVWLILVWLVLKVVHELAHGICCRKYGGEVKEAGALLLLFAPMAYVDVTSSWRLSSRWQRICISFAGMYIELAVAFVAAILWCRVDNGLFSDLCYNVIIMASITSLLFNANPLMRFDGYYILSDTLNVVNLYNRGRETMWRWFDRFILGVPTTRIRIRLREKLIISSYGVCSTVWKVLLTITLLIAASVLFEGLGLILAAIGGIFWVVMPLAMQARRINGLRVKGQISVPRVLVSGLAFASVIGLAFSVLQAPSLTTAPAIVKHKNEQVIRAGADGFLRNILVVDGQKVSSGQVLLQLHNPQLDHELVELTSQLESAEIQARVYQDQDELAKSQAEFDVIISLRQQIAEIEAQLKTQTVVAKIDGIVLARQLGNQIDRFFKQGDLLMTVANSRLKTVIVSISEDDIDCLPATKGEVVTLSLSGSQLIECRLSSIQPRASDRLAHPAMGASAGGTLAVRPIQSKNGESEMRLIRPRFVAELTVPEGLAGSIFVGQTGEAFLGVRETSLGSYLFVSTRRWFANQVKQATQGISN